MKKCIKTVASFLALVLTSTFCFGYSGGSGTSIDPYLLANKTDLLALAGNESDYDKHFKMTADIDLNGESFTKAVISPNTTSSPWAFSGTIFTGTLNGNGFKIKNLTVVAQSTSYYIGLFGNIGSSAIIQDVGLESCNISDGTSFVGGLVGYSSGTIDKCYSTGSVNASDFAVGGLVGSGSLMIRNSYSTCSVSGSESIGGLAGYNNAGTITNCNSSGSVSSDSLRGGGLVGRNIRGTIGRCYSKGTVNGIISVGGLVGENYDGSISGSYSTGEVNGIENVGGLVGENNNEGSISDSYSTGAVIGGDDSRVIGGLAGYNNLGSISNCYSTGAVSGSEILGGLVGWNYEAPSIFCFWDTQTSGQSTSGGGIGKTTAEMKTESTFTSVGWDFVDTWEMDGYPALNIPYSGGAGTSADPYLIANKVDLLELAEKTEDYDKYFKMIADIDLAEESFTTAVIAPDTSSSFFYQGTKFSGSFDGNGYKISNLTISGDTTQNYFGLFGSTDSSARIEQLGLKACSICCGDENIGCIVGENFGSITECYVTGSVTGGSTAGGIAGYNDGAITGCYSVVSILGGSVACGCLVGKNEINGTIIECYSDGSVTGGLQTGGLVGENTFGGTISRCYSAASVDGYNYVGGLVGKNSGPISECYATGSTTGDLNIGGLVGENNYFAITKCYSTGVVDCSDETAGGLVGVNNTYGTEATFSFWNTQTSGMTTSDGGTGKTTTEMQTESTFTSAGWDFVDTWYMNGYPNLQTLGFTYQYWLANFSVPVSEQEYSDSPADDDIQNLLKYAMGLNPMLSYSADDVMEPITEENQFSVIYKKSKQTTMDVRLFPVTTDSLSATNWSADGFQFEKLSETSSNETWKASIPIKSENGYIRLQAKNNN